MAYLAAVSVCEGHWTGIHLKAFKPILWHWYVPQPPRSFFDVAVSLLIYALSLYFTLSGHTRRSTLFEFIFICSPYCHICLQLFVTPYCLLVSHHAAISLNHPAKYHGRHLNISGEAVRVYASAQAWLCSEFTEPSFKEVSTHVLNWTVKLRYNGEKAYATPPATAKNAPHYILS